MITDMSLSETQLRRAVVLQSKKSVFLCDKTKIGVAAPYNLMMVNESDCVVTNCKASDNFFNCKDIIVTKEA